MGRSCLREFKNISHITNDSGSVLSGSIVMAACSTSAPISSNQRYNKTSHIVVLNYCKLPISFDLSFIS